MTGFPGVCCAHFCGGSAGRSVTVVIPVGREVRRLGIHRRGLAGLGICRPRRQCAGLPGQHVEAGDQVHLRVPPPEVCLLPQQDACRGHTATGRGSPSALIPLGVQARDAQGLRLRLACCLAPGLVTASPLGTPLALGQIAGGCPGGQTLCRPTRPPSHSRGLPVTRGLGCLCRRRHVLQQPRTG